MEQALLTCRDLTVAADDAIILHQVDLAMEPGTTHVLMGPNGAGKSTLGKTLMGDPEYQVRSGTIVFAGQDITELSPDKRSQAGLFMSFQAPVEVPGVPLFTYLRALVAAHPELGLKGKGLKQRVDEIMEQLSMDRSYLDRELNVGFSGGEKKKVEMLQLLLLAPKLAILDETDSGLDVDALDTVSRAIRIYQDQLGGTVLMITHNTRILEHLDVDAVHVMVRGRLVASGEADLIADIDRSGFERYVTALFNAGVDARMAQAEGKAGAVQAEQAVDEALEDELDAAGSRVQRMLDAADAALAAADAAEDDALQTAVTAAEAAQTRTGSAAVTATAVTDVECANPASMLDSNATDQEGRCHA